MDLITLAVAKKAAEQSGKSAPQISSATINEDGELIFILTNGTEINAGELPCYDNEEAIEELRKQIEAIPQSDWNQEDNTKLDFIKNKPKLGTLAEKSIVEKEDLSSDVQEELNKNNIYVGSGEMPDGYLLQIDPEVSSENISIQSDYEQNDETASDYIKNRTHYKETICQEETIIFPETEIDFLSLGDMGYMQSESLNIQAGDTVKVLWNDQQYECKTYLASTITSDFPDDAIIFGNLYYTFNEYPNTKDIPFIIFANYSIGETGFISPGCWMVHFSEISEIIAPISVKIFTGGKEIIYHKINIDYLPTTEDISLNSNNIITSQVLAQYLRDNKPDWDIDNYDDPGYIKNRPFYKYLAQYNYSESLNIDFDENGIYASSYVLPLFGFIFNNNLSRVINIDISWPDGNTYNCKLRNIYYELTDEFGDHYGDNYYVFGNVSEINSNYSDDIAPFLIYLNYNPETQEKNVSYIKIYDKSLNKANFLITVKTEEWNYNTIDPSYLPKYFLQGNWDEENSNSYNYIHNKPFDRRKVNESFDSGLGNMEISLDNNGICIISPVYFKELIESYPPTDYNKILVHCYWNDTKYTYRVRILTDEYYDENKDKYIEIYYYAFGNISSINSDYTDTAPFLIYINYNPETHQTIDGAYIISPDNLNSIIQCEISWVYEHWNYDPIDYRYLPLVSEIIENYPLPITSGGVYKAIESVDEKISQINQSTSLPAVNASDNGKFLRVVNGKWAATTILNAEGVEF